MPKPDDSVYLSVDTPEGPQQVRISSPAKPYFSRDLQLTKLDIAHYFLSIAPAALLGIRSRPIVLKRFVNGACLADTNPEPFYQKRAPSDLPPWMRTVTLSFPSGRTAEEVVVDNAPGLLWIVNLGCMELHPHPVLASDLNHPNELRVDLDPNPGVPWTFVVEVALVAKAVLEESGLTPFVKTSGSRGLHLLCRIHPQWPFTEVRRAALALAREVERRAPSIASSKWWKEERHGVFLDYNQNAKDRTTAAAYSVRPLPDARVSAPLHWHELPSCNPADFNVLTLPARYAAIGDPHANINETAASLQPLLDLAARDEASGLADAPWPPHFAKQDGESKRVQPSKAKKDKPPASDAAGKSFTSQLEEGFGNKRFRKHALRGTGFSTEPFHNHALKETGFTTEPVRKHALKGTGFSPSIKPSQEQEALASEGKPGSPRKSRTPRHPLLTIAQSPDKTAALAGLERWKHSHPEAASHLAEYDILTDRMRGSAHIWYRIRVNLRNVPEAERPPQQTPDPDDDPTRHWREPNS
jgi:bifunctional non-homologous end joining protein LigD